MTRKVFETPQQYKVEHIIALEDRTDSIKHTVQVAFTRHKKQPGYLMEITKSNGSVNGRTILDGMEDVLWVTGKAFDKLQLLVNDEGKIQEILNYPEILEQWKQRKEYVELTYKGAHVINTLDMLEQTMIDPSKVLYVISCNRFVFIYLYLMFRATTGLQMPIDPKGAWSTHPCLVPAAVGRANAHMQATRKVFPCYNGCTLSTEMVWIKEDNDIADLDECFSQLYGLEEPDSGNNFNCNLHMDGTFAGGLLYDATTQMDLELANRYWQKETLKIILT